MTRLAAAAAAVATALLVAGLAADPGWAQPRTAAPARATTDQADPSGEAYAAWHDAVAAAVTAHPDRYGGVYRDPTTGGLVVTLAPRTDTPATRAAVLAAAQAAVTRFGAAARAAAQAMPLRFARVPRTLSEQQRVLDAVTRAHLAHDPVASSVRQWWAEPRTGRVTLGLDHRASWPELARLRARFGGAVDVAVVATGEPTSRGADSAPWYGGDRITSPVSTICSTGFGVRSGTASYELTAGHCGSYTWKVGSATLGWTPLRDYTNGGLDTEAVTASSVAGRVYTGCLTCSTSLPVKGRWDPVVGDVLCFDGSVTGLVCAATVSSTGRCILMNSGITTCHLAVVQKSDGTAVTTNGDSGGPVFYKTSTAVYASGTIVGFYGAKSVGLVEPLQSILPALGLSLVTG